MTRRGDFGLSKLPVILIIVAVSSVVSSVAGFGIFEIKILSVDVNGSPSRCSSGSSPSSCKANDAACASHTLLVQACLSHHQLPLPFNLKCTLGTEVLVIPYAADENNKASLLKPEAVMSIPFTFSWLGGFGLSVSASWRCRDQESTETSPISHIAVADHIFPSRQWTSFTNPHSPKGDTSTDRHLLTSRHSAASSNKRSSRPMASKAGDHPSNSLGSLSKIFYVNSSNYIHNNTSLDHRSASDLSQREADSNVNIRNGDNLQTSYAEVKIVGEMQDISRANNLWRSRPNAEFLTTGSQDDKARDNDLILLSTSAVVRLRGSSLLIAVRVVCQEHYFGKSCSTFCRPRDDLLGHYDCSESGSQVCHQGWTGHNCNEAMCSDRCAPSRGSCKSPNTCQCKEGWFGENCEECEKYPGCQNGVCYLPGQCVCDNGWSGPLCDIVEPFCEEHRPCQNGGTCSHDGFHNYTCSCLPGFTGAHCQTPLCEQNICLHGGTCQIAEGKPYCLCSLHFVGPHCQHRLDIQSTRTRCNGSNCAHESKHFHQQSHQPQNRCTNATCLSEFLISEPCQGHVCYNRGKCAMTPDSKIHKCACPFPFTGPQCLEILDPCKSNPCQNGTVCSTTDLFHGSYRCLCAPGFYGNLCNFKRTALSLKTTTCDKSVVCQNGGRCEKSGRSGQYFCKCQPEFDGEFCEVDRMNPCSTHICLHGGNCVLDEDGHPECVCEKGYRGKLCRRYAKSTCSGVVCQNDGICRERDGEYVCDCKKNFEGVFCQNKFIGGEPVITVLLETLTVRNEKLEVKIETIVKSAGHITTHNLQRLTLATIELFIVYVVLL